MADTVDDALEAMLQGSHCDHVDECRANPASTDCGADPCELVEVGPVTTTDAPHTIGYLEVAVPDYRMELIKTLAELALWQMGHFAYDEGELSVSRIKELAS